MGNENKITDYEIIIIIVVLLLLVLSFLTFGKVDIDNIGFPDEYKDNKEEAKRKHKRLKN